MMDHSGATRRKMKANRDGRGDVDRHSSATAASHDDTSSSVPFGNDVSVDVIDLVASDTEETNNTIDLTASTTINAAAPPPMNQQNHPRRIIAASRKRRRERQQEKDKQKDEERERRKRANVSERNFIIIDDSSDEENNERTNATETAEAPAQRPKTTTANERVHWSKWPNAFQQDREFNYQFTQEAAQEIQERLLREAAERVARMKASEEAQDSQPTCPQFSAPVLDVSEQYPQHWKWKDPHACLGLPRNASLALVKGQYRRLARIYHPDKAKSTDDRTSNRFHAIAKAYRKLSNEE